MNPERSGLLRRAVEPLRLGLDFGLTAIVVAGVLPLWALPWRAARAAGRLYGYAAWCVWPAARRIGMINLRRAHGPAMTRRRARAMLVETFGHLGQSIAEGIQFSWRFQPGAPGWERFYLPEDAELERRILADPRPLIFVTGHLGSWEVATAIAGHRARDRGAVIGRRVDNPFLNALVRWMRTPDPGRWIEKRGATSEALRRLRQGHNVALLMDENGGWRGINTIFLGRPASTSRMAALLSLMTGAPIVLGAAVRRQNTDRLLFRLALIVPPAAEDERGPDQVAILTQEVVSRYEAWVKDDPTQWRWIHGRWKTRLGEGWEETYTRRDVERAFAGGEVADVPTPGPRWRSAEGPRA
jgi:KDO2-lipid IV(A) lauroyltransferase